MYSKTKKGFYKPDKPEKYKGDPNNIVFRSGWEYQVMRWCDTNVNVLEWGSEEFFVRYVSPYDNKPHRYFPDFWVKIRDKHDVEKVIVLEVKPYKMTLEPSKPKRITKNYVKEVVDYGVNQAKWASAREYCKDRNWGFQVITEKEIFNK